jgi:hypothetical protein
VGYSLGIDPTAFRLGAAALILIIGIVLLVPALQNRFALAAAPVAVGGQALIERLRPSGIGGQFTSRIAKPLMGAALVSVGVFVLTGFDKVVEASLTRAMPDWLVTVTTRL